MTGKLILQPIGGTTDHVLTGLQYSSPDQNSRWVIVSLTSASTLLNVFTSVDVYSKYLSNQDPFVKKMLERKTNEKWCLWVIAPHRDT